MAQKFLKVKCKKCNNEQKIFSRSAMAIKCLVCGEALAKSSGGKTVLEPNAELQGELKAG